MEICRDAPPLSFLFLSDQYHTLTDNGKKEQLFRPARLPAFFTRFQVEFIGHDLENGFLFGLSMHLKF